MVSHAVRKDSNSKLVRISPKQVQSLGLNLRYYRRDHVEVTVNESQESRLEATTDGEIWYGTSGTFLTSYLTPPLPDCELLKFLADEHERHPESHFQGCTHYQDVSTVVWRVAWVASPLFSIPRRPAERE